MKKRILAILAIIIILTILLIPQVVLADTTLTVYPTADAYIGKSVANENYGTNTVATLSNSATYAKRLVLKFSTTDVPAGATITSATLSVYIPAYDGGEAYVNVLCQRMTRDWTEGTGGTTDVSWNHYTGTSHWTAAGGDVTTTDQASTTNPNDPAWMSFDVKALTQDAIANRSNVLNVQIKYETESGDASDPLIRLREYTGTSYDPKLVIVYALPVLAVSTLAASSVSYATATLNGNITVIGTGNATIRGFQYGKTSGALNLDTHEHGSYGVGTYSLAVDSLDANTKYYFQAYATDSVSTYYGTELDFDTLAYTAPTLDLLTIGTATEATAVLNGNITGVDGDNATVRGVAYGEVSGAPNLDSHTHGSYGVGNYSVSLSGLDYDTLYFYKFYATNAGGTGYSAEGNFTTLLPLCLEPGNLTATQTGVGNITITWDMGLYAEDTIIRIGEDICPGNITDGYLVYNGNGTTATYSGLSLGMHEYCIRAWSSNNTGNSTGYTEVKIGGTGMTALGNIILLGILMFASLACTISAYAFRKPPVAFLGAGLWALLGFFAFTLSTSISPIQITDIYMGLFWLSMMMTIVSMFEPAIMKAPSIDEPEPEAELSQADQMKAEYASMQKEMGVGIFTARRKRRRLPRL